MILCMKFSAQSSLLVLPQTEVKTKFDFKNASDVAQTWDSIFANGKSPFDFLSDETWLTSAEFYYEKALKEKDELGAAKLRFPLAYLYHTTTRFKKAIPLLEILVKDKNHISEPIYNQSLLKLEESYIRAGELKPAIDIRNIRIKEKYTNHFWEIYQEVGLIDEAIRDYKLQVAFPVKSEWRKIFYYSSLASLYFKNDQLDSAEYYYRMGYESANKVIADTNYADKSHYSEYTKFYYRALMLGNISEIYMKRNEYAKAIPYLKDDIEKSKSIAEISNAILKRMDLAECYLKLQQPKISKAYLDTVTEYLKINKWYDFDYRNLKLRSEYFLYMKQYDSAAVNLNKYLVLKETVEERLRKNKAIAILAIMDTDKQKTTVANQKLELETAKLKEADQRAHRNLLYGGIAILIMLLIGIVYNGFLKAKRRKEIEKSLKEKEVLLKEVHHRVKNNLTTLKSLFYLQAKSSNIEEVKKALEECQYRIQSMALIHQNLYEENESGKIELKHFLSQLFAELELSIKPSDKIIAIELEGKSIELDMSTALFLGLIINELATNSFKYAFTNKNTGKLGVKLLKEHQQLIVVYYDDGAGLSLGYESTNGGFGFKLMRILTEQINAKMTYQNSINNSQFIIEIPLEK